MAIKKEYLCAVHGDFEATKPLCPSGCKGDAMVQRVFRTAPGIQTQYYRNMNRTLENLATDHRLSNMSNAGGEGMRKADAGTRKRMDQALQMVAPNGRAVDEFFKPMGDRFKSSAQAVSASEAVNPMADTRPLNGSVYKDQTGATVVGNGIRLGAVQPKLEAPAFDGSKMGLPT